MQVRALHFLRGQLLCLNCPKIEEKLVMTAIAYFDISFLLGGCDEWLSKKMANSEMVSEYPGHDL